jgi:aryl-alcohol dehydrogenase-like predicted oxidoreductase
MTLSTLDVAAHFARRSPHAVPSLALGTMNFGKRTPAAEAERILARALELGLRVIDTANAYVDGESERIVGRFTKRCRAEVLLATKVGFGRVAGKPEGLAPERILAAIDESLTRLGTDYVDLYYLHVPDHTVPIDESLSAMKALIDSRRCAPSACRTTRLGRCSRSSRPAIASTCPARSSRSSSTTCSSASSISSMRASPRSTRFTRPSTTLWPEACSRAAIGPRAASRRVRVSTRTSSTSIAIGRPSCSSLPSATECSRRRRASALVELAYAWMRTRSFVDSVLVGPGTVDQLDSAVSAMHQVLDAETRVSIEELAREQLGTATAYAR